MLSPRELLAEAAKMFTVDPKKWTRTVLARNANDDSVDPHDPSAVCWCAVGAVIKVAHDSDPSIAPKIENDAYDLFETLIPGLHYYDVYEFNDRSTTDVAAITEFLKEEANAQRP